jgi:hypothetical protein
MDYWFKKGNQGAISKITFADSVITEKYNWIEFGLSQKPFNSSVFLRFYLIK